MSDRAVHTAAGRGLDGPGAQPLRIALILSLLVGVWVFARFGEAPPRGAQLSGQFEGPVVFRVSPPEQVTEINVRAGPGRQYRIVGHLPRNSQVVGVEQLPDNQGAPWIRLTEERGYIKQSILTPQGWAR